MTCSLARNWVRQETYPVDGLSLHVGEVLVHFVVLHLLGSHVSVVADQLSDTVGPVGVVHISFLVDDSLVEIVLHGEEEEFLALDEQVTGSEEQTVRSDHGASQVTHVLEVSEVEQGQITGSAEDGPLSTHRESFEVRGDLLGSEDSFLGESEHSLTVAEGSISWVRKRVPSLVSSSKAWVGTTTGSNCSTVSLDRYLALTSGTFAPSCARRRL